MKRIIALTPHFAVTSALAPADFAQAADLGFKSILSNLPEGELPQVPDAAEAARLAAAAGLQYRHLPATKLDVLGSLVVDGTIAAARELEGPILAHCASGMRSALAWGAAASRFQPAERVLAVLAKAGFDMRALQEELEGLRLGGDEPAPLLLRAEA